MSSIREQIVARMAAVLEAVVVNAVAVPVYRSREVALARGDVPAQVVRPSTEETQSLGDQLDVSHFNVDVETIVRGDVWDSVADPIVVAAHALLLGDAPLAALCTKIRRVAAKWEAHEADQTAGVLTQTYRVVYTSPIDQL